jgi:hypothetical protein
MAQDVSSNSAYSNYSNVATVTTLPLWLPMPENGISMWLTPGSTESGSNGIQVWHDISGNRNDAIQTNTASQPQFASTQINGQPAIHFNGTSSYLSVPLVMSGASAAEMFVVLRAQPVSGTNNGALALSGPTLYPAANGQISDSFASASNYTVGPAGVDITQPHIYNVTSAANNWVARLDTQVLFTSSSNTVSPGNGSPVPVIGAVYNSSLSALTNWFTGDIAEIIVYNRALSSQERQNVTQQLAARYAMAISFPGDANNDGLPDSWETQYFGTININANADYDGNGSSVAQDYVAGNNPVDFYNGRPFVIQPSPSGNNYTYDLSGRLSKANYPNGANIAIVSDAASNLTSVTNYGAIVLWRVAQGLPADGTGEGADTAILANDSVPNLAKYAFGLNPTVAVTFPCPNVTLSSLNSGNLTLTYTRPDPAPPDIVYTVQVSGDRVNWTSGSGATNSVSTTINNGIATVVVSDATPVGSPSFGRWIRLSLQRVPQS